ncbi:MAG: flippase [Methanobrevibacter sp.]|nr:flippase [Candidatus Methanovirga aequatorialis]
MNSIQKLFKNTSWLILGILITNICAFFWTMTTLNYLGVSESGMMKGAISSMTMAAIFMDVGVSTYIVREVSKQKDLTNKYLGNIIPLKIVLSTTVLVVSFIILKLTNCQDSTTTIYLLFGIQNATASMTALFNGIFQAYEKTQHQSIGTTLSSIFQLLFIVAVVELDYGLIAIVMAYIFSSIINLGYIIRQVKKIVDHVKIEFDYKFWVRTLKNAYPFGVTNSFATIYATVDIIMLSQLSGNFYTGIYSAAYNVITLFATLYYAYVWVTFPLMSRLYHNSSDFLGVSYEKSIKYLLILTIPICIGISFYSQDVLRIMPLNNDFFEASKVLRVLIWSLLFTFLNGVAIQLLNSTKYELSVTKISVISCIFITTINIVLIPKYNYIGASVSLILSGLLQFILMNYTISKEGLYRINKHLIIDIIKIIISSAILVVILSLIKVSLWIAIPIGMAVYLIAIIIMKTLDKQDVIIVKELLGK